MMYDDWDYDPRVHGRQGGEDGCAVAIGMIALLFFALAMIFILSKVEKASEAQKKAIIENSNK